MTKFPLIKNFKVVILLMSWIFITGYGFTAEAEGIDENINIFYGEQENFEEENGYFFSGSLKNFTQVERYYDHPSFLRRYEGSNQSGLRLKIDWRINNWAALQVHGTENAVLMTNENLALTHLNQTGSGDRVFRRARFNNVQINREDLILESDIDYLNISFNFDKNDLILGRQAVSFGRTFFWNPVDWLSAFLPLTLDREYKPGIDALRLERQLDLLSNCKMVYAANRGKGKDDYALIGEVSINRSDWDMDVLAGTVLGDIKGGFGISGEIKGAGLRGEGSLTKPKNKSEQDFFQGTLEIDYRWPGSFELMGEFYYNGSGSGDEDNYDTLLLQENKIVDLAKYYLGLRIQYEFFPVLRTEASYIINLIDNSCIIYPSLIYSVSNESDLILGASVASGKRPAGNLIRSEFGMLPSIYFMQYKIDF